MFESLAGRLRGTVVVSGFLISAWVFTGPAMAADEAVVGKTAATTSSPQLNWVRKGSLSDRGTTQHNLSLATPLAASGVPVSAAPTRTANAQVTVLRWRTPGVAQTRLQIGDGSAATEIVTLSGVPGSSQPVRQVSATDLDLPAAIADASADTFADSPHKPPRVPQPPAPLQVEPTAQLLAQQPPATLDADATWQDDPAPAPQVLPSPAADPAAGKSEPAAKKSCDRIYNRRDCCADEQRCVDARRQWNLDAISKISLDITPSLRPDELNPYTEEEERNRDLAQAPVRSWRDHQGNPLGTGRLTNIKQGRVLVLNENNQTLSIPFDDLCDDDLCFLTAWWRVPTECTFGDDLYAGRNWAPSTMTWKASALCHKPLYFEEVQLERYGHTAGPLPQPVLSGAHFFLNLVTLPYQAGINPPWECQYALGYYRPGSCAPWLVPPIPLSVRGALSQAGVIVGGVYLFP